jgi:hypothetical protein
MQMLRQVNKSANLCERRLAIRKLNFAKYASAIKTANNDIASCILKIHR